MKGAPIHYTAAELAWVEEHRHMIRREAHALFIVTFQRDDVSLSNYVALCKRNGWSTGRDGRFAKGQPAYNKGRKGTCAPGSEKGWFRKGQLPHNTKHLGHERVSKDGYVEISVDEPNPHTGFERRYVLKHRWLWEKANGPVPEGMALKCLVGDKTNTDPSNWQPVPRALLPRLNGRFGRNYDTAPQELKPTIMATAKLEHAARGAKK